jgi:hypothetical protein
MARDSETAKMTRFVAIAAILVMTLAVVATSAAGAEWQPRGIVPSGAALRDVLAAVGRASIDSDPRFAQRREHWTYVTGTRRLAVTVAVSGADFRTSLELDGLTYTAGRKGGARWRADGNGTVHGVQADLQSDALDRAPQAIFGLDAATCTLEGEAHLPAAAWVIQTHEEGDKPAFLYVDEATGSIVREIVRDGKSVITTDFDHFEALDDGPARARHWHVNDGNKADSIDVTVDAIEPAVITPADLAFPQRRVFAPAAPLERSADLDASFHGGRITIGVTIDGKPHRFILDTGTASITIDPALANRYGGATLSHAVLPRMEIGPLALDRVSAYTVPLGRLDGGILGFDFFFGHVVEIDYLDQRVRVLSDSDARAVFADPQTTIVAANVDQGLPLVQAGFGPAQSNAFALDTGSPRLYVMEPFMTKFAAEIAAHWTRTADPFVERYLEGAIELQPYRVADFEFANAEARDIIVGGQVPTTLADGLAIPFDGIIGTDVLQNFDLYFDYDNARLAVRH